ncbi:LON peptidase substrate-binding domain-containing protein [Azospirillum sp. TSO35-2]|uniref:LON peptidase substrate-binding domain-containing protein n=1 Tax=Azospirillum sp. TSO35-2 TaxID=716796 RepID=UPI000D61EA2E|nr:LON peptidase substrate-binding domain-containing protein [Azospirillum sp. TSO35-2]PWC39172.1 peptidase S16 [Azospirillum sp. TSO35-2]
MTRNPFDPSFGQLPTMMPIFPLAGVLLLPRARLPLNVFEPRYLAMIEDALGAGRMIGMIQPTDPDCRKRDPAVYPNGCAGRITSFAETDDGRFLITLTGVARFAVAREAEGVRGYRRVVPDWKRFEADLEPEPCGGVDRPRLLSALKSYFRIQGLSVDWKSIESTLDERLVNSLAMICPFSPGEKQALLEAATLAERGKLLIGLVEMAILDSHEGDGPPPRH